VDVQEALLFALSSSHRLMRVLRTIVRALIIDVLGRQAEDSSGWRTKFEELTPHCFVGDIQSPFRN